MAAAEQGLPLQVFCRAVLREQKLQAQISSAAAADTTEEKVSRLEQLIADQRVENEVLWAELGEIETKHKAELAQQAKRLCAWIRPT